jgi:hypothetical protein
MICLYVLQSCNSGRAFVAALLLLRVSASVQSAREFCGYRVRRPSSVAWRKEPLFVHGRGCTGACMVWRKITTTKPAEGRAPDDYILCRRRWLDRKRKVRASRVIKKIMPKADNIKWVLKHATVASMKGCQPVTCMKTLDGFVLKWIRIYFPQTNCYGQYLGHNSERKQCLYILTLTL